MAGPPRAPRRWLLGVELRLRRVMLPAVSLPKILTHTRSHFGLSIFFRDPTTSANLLAPNKSERPS